MKNIIIVLLFCLLPSISFALESSGYNNQYSEKYLVVGARLAIGGSSLKGMDKYERIRRIPGTDLVSSKEYTSGIYPAWDLGLTVQYMNKQFLMQGDFTFTYLNTKLNGAYTPEQVKRIRLFYNNININLGTKIPLNDNFRFVIGMGPYIGFDYARWFTGSYSTGYIDDNVLDGENANFPSFDFGASVLAGIEIRNIQLGFNYFHGLVNVVKDDFPLYNRAYKLSMIYFF